MEFSTQHFWIGQTRMHADICDADDPEAVECFKSILRQMGAEKVDQSWGLGVDVFTLQVGVETLTVFSDAYSIDIDGPEFLVQNVVSLFNQLLGKNE